MTIDQPTFILVPGAGGVASYWHHVQARLTARGIGSIAVDLPGPDPSMGLPDYVDLVVEAAEGHERVVLVGQSLGGFSASWAADRVTPVELVLVNAMIPLPGETAGEWWAATDSGPARAAHDVREGRDPEQFDIETYFLHDVAPAALEGLGDPQDESDAVFAAPWEPAAWPDVPTRVIAGSDDRFFPFEFQQRVARDRLGLEVEAVPGGHLPAFSHPDELTSALVRTL